MRLIFLTIVFLAGVWIAWHCHRVAQRINAAEDLLLPRPRHDGTVLARSTAGSPTTGARPGRLRNDRTPRRIS